MKEGECEDGAVVVVVLVLLVGVVVGWRKPVVVAGSSDLELTWI